MAVGFTGLIQTVARQKTRSKPFATWKLSVEVGPWLPPKHPQASSSSKLFSQQWLLQLRTEMPRVTYIQAWGTGQRLCSAFLTLIPSDLFTTEKRAHQTKTRRNSTSS